MLRVREVAGRGSSREEDLYSAPVSPSASSTGYSRPARMAAMAALGLSLGVGCTVLTVSLVQADDDAGIRDFHRQEAANRQAQRASFYVPAAVTRPQPRAIAYAPARNGWQIPLLQMAPDGRLAHPPVDLNPFRQRAVADAGPRPGQNARPRHGSPLSPMAHGPSACAFATASMHRSASCAAPETAAGP